jgi:hypothetical protein
MTLSNYRILKHRWKINEYGAWWDGIGREVLEELSASNFRV